MPSSNLSVLLSAQLGKAIRSPVKLILQNPALILLLIRLAEVLLPLLVKCRRFLSLLGTQHALSASQELDLDLVQGCLLSAENLLNLGRVEKRTLFQVSASKLLGGNRHLVQVLRDSARQCHRQSQNCLVARWIPPEERYHILQMSLNAVSALFGANYVHQNALGESGKSLFKSTWYCLTMMTPTRPENRMAKMQTKTSAQPSSMETCTFTDMTRTPRQTLRICIVNETEVRAIADGKLRPPNWGFFNSRHAERYRMLCDFCRNFQTQLVRTPADSRSVSTRSPFTSENAHKVPESKPDGGLMKRVQSQPNLAKQSLSNLALAQQKQPLDGLAMTTSHDDGVKMVADAALLSTSIDESERAYGASDENCFLRLHVPHFVMSPTSSHSSKPTPQDSPGSLRASGEPALTLSPADPRKSAKGLSRA
eukprot:TRINITY_DN20801_c0_g1_i1.p1 TRINITY_DN20801_c0_g1~~TRINITY_DN20801_c0_g1_i1.p1  ORF type:complete len:424 (-),score=40.78 TRINITY_DN20801_c0_g1_i1:44-1315(-)